MAARYEKRKEEHYLCARRRGEKEAGKEVSMALDTKWALKISIVKCLRYGDAKSGREMKAFGAEVFTFFYMVRWCIQLPLSSYFVWIFFPSCVSSTESLCVPIKFIFIIL